MDKQNFFQFHQNKDRIWIWVNGTCDRISLSKFLALPDNLQFNVEGCHHDYKLVKGLVTIVK